MKNNRKIIFVLIVAAVVSTGSKSAWGLTRIRDIARPLGERNNKLIGQGLVVGLKGTGDGGDSLVTMKMLQVCLQKLGSPAEVSELKNAKNAAIVVVTADLGRNGIRNGDKIDVQVSSLYNAKSLEGGMLIVTHLRSMSYADDRVYAVAQGPITIPNAQTPTVGVVPGGADVEENYLHRYVNVDARTGRASFTLVLDDEQANFQTAKTIAMIINEEITAPGGRLSAENLAAEMAQEPTAYVIDPKNIEVLIPPKLADNPALFIARVLNMQVDLPDPEAAVVINEKTGTIAITGNVQIAPSIVHVNGLMIRIVEPAPQPQPGAPLVQESQWTTFDTTGSKGVDIQTLIDALDRLNVPTKEKISALYELQTLGALRARIISR
ncbi:MAG: flagellar basal body P-ring protein FlgI [Sedimentisphaerales bacterium]|nr:flagellar basal body P-ring protein FlgI [Sedimentisphaerales bacterium]